MSEEAISIACEYMSEIVPKYQSSVLKILYAYCEKSKTEHTKRGGGN